MYRRAMVHTHCHDHDPADISSGIRSGPQHCVRLGSSLEGNRSWQNNVCKGTYGHGTK